MSFKQFHSSSVRKQGIRCGGKWTADRAPLEYDLEVWTKVLALSGTGAELRDKGAPTLVRSLRVSGFRYIFTFADKSTVAVYHCSWTKTLEVLPENSPLLEV
jgi:hypothetical protein